MTTLLQWFIVTEKGNVRDVNEDSFQAHPDSETLHHTPTYQPPGGRLCVVADGMGGHRGGKDASRMAVQRIGQLYYTQFQGTPPDQALSAAIQQTNHDIVQVGQSDPSLQDMGTTMVAATVQGNHVYVANVGDSRAYLWRNGSMRLLSHDDRWVAQQMRDHRLTEEQARNHEYRNLLTQYLGNPQGVQPHTRSEMLQPEDRLLLCTDGLFEMLTDEEISKLLAGPPERVPHRLVRLALTRQATDNITVAVGYYGSLRPISRRSASMKNPVAALAASLGINIKMLFFTAMMLVIALVLLLFLVIPTLMARQSSTSETAIGSSSPQVATAPALSRAAEQHTATATPEPTPVAPTSTLQPTTTPTPAPSPTPPPTLPPTTLTITATEHYTAIMAATPQPVDPRTRLQSESWEYTYRNEPAGPQSQLGSESGNFIIVIAVLQNQTGQEQPVPHDFFVLKDAQGRAYATQPHLQGGGADRSMRDAIPANGGQYSIPVIFNVEPDATDLVFFARSNPQQGWRIKTVR